MSENTEHVMFVYTVILPVSPKRNWAIGQMPQTVRQLQAEIGVRQQRGEDVNQTFTRRPVSAPMTEDQLRQIRDATEQVGHNHD